MIAYIDGVSYFLESNDFNCTDFLSIDLDWFPPEVATIKLTL